MYALWCCVFVSVQHFVHVGFCALVQRPLINTASRMELMWALMAVPYWIHLYVPCRGIHARFVQGMMLR